MLRIVSIQDAHSLFFIFVHVSCLVYDLKDRVQKPYKKTPSHPFAPPQVFELYPEKKNSTV